MKYATPEHVHLRPATTDADIWNEVVERNVYRLPHVFAPGDWVLDLGAHTGSFAWRAAHTGAAVVAVEPCRNNYPLLLHNLKPVWDRVICLHAAAWRSDVPPCVLGFQPNWAPCNTGGGCVMGDATTAGHEALGVPLDHLLALRPVWRLLKLDIEGAEFPVLGSSRLLDRVREVAGEYHERASVMPFADVMPCKMDALKFLLEAADFTVTVDAKGAGMGYFRAVREA